MLNMWIYENSETVSVLSISLLGIIAFIRSHCDATRIDVHLVQSLPHSTHCHLDGGGGDSSSCQFQLTQEQFSVTKYICLKPEILQSSNITDRTGIELVRTVTVKI